MVTRATLTPPPFTPVALVPVQVYNITLITTLTHYNPHVSGDNAQTSLPQNISSSSSPTEALGKKTYYKYYKSYLL